MRCFESLLLSLVTSMGCLHGCESPAPDPKAEAPLEPAAAKAVDDLLARWERKSSEIQSVNMEFTQVCMSQLFGVEKKYEGHYSAKGTDRALMSLALKEGDKAAKMEEQLLLADGKLYQFFHGTHQAFVLPVSEDRAKEEGGGFLANLGHYLSLSMRPDGPRFFLRVRAEDLKANYRVEILREREDDYVLELLPRTARSRAASSHVRIALNKESLRPTVIRHWSPNGQDATTIHINRITINPAIADDLFRPRALEGWTVVDSAFYVFLGKPTADPVPAAAKP